MRRTVGSKIKILEGDNPKLIDYKLLFDKL